MIRRLKPVRHEDERGWFCETWRFSGEQFNVDAQAYNQKAGTLRGLHYQPDQTKIVRVIRGSIFDVVVDPRSGKWESITLSADGEQVIVSQGLAHGYCTLEDDTEVLYKLSVPQDGSATGIRWDSVGIPWPEFDYIISEQDQKWASFSKSA